MLVKFLIPKKKKHNLASLERNNYYYGNILSLAYIIFGFKINYNTKLFWVSHCQEH